MSNILSEARAVLDAAGFRTLTPSPVAEVVYFEDANIIGVLYVLDSVDSILSRWREADPNGDHWENEKEQLLLFWMGQRKGLYRWTTVDISKSDENAVRVWLQQRLIIPFRLVDVFPVDRGQNH